MQYDLERALVEISLLQQREDLLQQQFKGQALELEKEFMKRLEDLRQTVILEFTMCKQESEQNMLAKLESLLNQMKEISRTDGKDLLGSSQGRKLEHAQELELKCGDSSYSSCNEVSKSKTSVSEPFSAEQKAALTEEMLQRISPKRLEQSVAVVRGWLESPTPSESSSVVIAENGKACCVNKPRLSSLPMPNLVSSVKEEVKIFATHRRAFSPPQPPRPPDILTETPKMDGVAMTALATTDTEEHTDVVGSSEPGSQELKSTLAQQESSQELKSTHAQQATSGTVLQIVGLRSADSQKVGGKCEKLKSAPVQVSAENVHPPIKADRDIIPVWEDCGSFKENAIGRRQEQQALLALRPANPPKKRASPSPSFPDKKPALRILKPKNFKISDLLVSDSEEDVVVR